MAESIPEHVYEDAAKTLAPEPAAKMFWAGDPKFRAAVESAFRAGQKAMLDYVSKNADVLSIRIPVAADRYDAALATIRDLGEMKEPDRADLYCEHCPIGHPS